MSFCRYQRVIRWVVLLSVVAFVCYRTVTSNPSPPTRRKLRGLQDGKPQEKKYYQDSALNFIIEYGAHYHLFDLFFDSEPGIKPILKQDLKALNGSSPRSMSLTEEYRVRSRENAKTYGVATAKVQPELALLNFSYTNNPTTDEMNLYNNRFRYGPNIDDRFMTINFDRDPVDEATPDSLAYIYFVGVNTELPMSYSYVCRFPEQNAESKVENNGRVRNLINRETANSIIRCAVPWSVSSALTKTSTEVVLDFVRLPVASTESALSLLSDIHVPRLHALDRRQFRYVIQTMLEDLNDPLVVEWVVYNIMLGVEHFYFYYNAKSPGLDLELSPLKPFFDANIITLVYFPFLHTVHFNNVQHAALNAYLRQFSRYTEFAGLWDIDEFFVPTNARLPYLNNQSYSAPALEGVVIPLAADPRVPAIIFNTLEMDCAEGAPSSAISTGVTTHCLRSGFLFEEYLHGHGKMIIRPSQISYIMTPHRTSVWQPFAQWVDDWQGGMFRHFNRFRYTYARQFPADKIGSDGSLRNFTLTSLRDLVGVTLQ